VREGGREGGSSPCSSTFFERFVENKNPHEVKAQWNSLGWRRRDGTGRNTTEGRKNPEGMAREREREKEVCRIRRRGGGGEEEGVWPGFTTDEIHWINHDFCLFVYLFVWEEMGGGEYNCWNRCICRK
jgi:hypothetical protein